MACVGFCLFPTAIGACGIAWNAQGAITGVQLPESGEAATRARMRRRYPDLDADLDEAAAPLPVQAAMARVAALLQGEPDDLCSIALDLDGVSDFHQRVYAVARAIPPGQTLTYGEVAARIGEPGAARAVGQALGLNPFAPIVPCHRVLAAGGHSGGFSAHGGARTKLEMLQIEGARLGNGPGLFD